MFQQKYPDEIEWRTIDEDTAREKLRAYFRDVDRALFDLHSGIVLRTPWAFWRWIPIALIAGAEG
jgi:hypothetical protein